MDSGISALKYIQDWVFTVKYSVVVLKWGSLLIGSGNKFSADLCRIHATHKYPYHNTTEQKLRREELIVTNPPSISGPSTQ
jgi:hypothetical protein